MEKRREGNTVSKMRGTVGVPGRIATHERARFVRAEGRGEVREKNGGPSGLSLSTPLFGFSLSLSAIPLG